MLFMVPLRVFSLPSVLWEAGDIFVYMLLQKVPLHHWTHRPWGWMEGPGGRELASHLNLSFDFLFFLFFPTISQIPSLHAWF